MSGELLLTTRRTVGLADVPLVFAAPRRLFAKVEDVAAYGWTLVILLMLVTLVGWATVQTGLIDRMIDQGVQEQIAKLEHEQIDLVDKTTLSKLIADAKKAGEFDRVVSRAQAVVLKPLGTLAAVLIISALLYGAVALTGKKPEWHTLLTICIYAGFIPLLGLAFRLVLIWRTGSLEVDATLGVIGRWLKSASAASDGTARIVAHVLSAADPFRIWFWLIMVIGLQTTAQLRGWRAWLTCGLFWLCAAGADVALQFVAAPGQAAVA